MFAEKVIRSNAVFTGLDEALPDRPVYMVSADVHTDWLNTKALEEAGYTPDMTFDGGHVGLDENGELKD